MDLCVIQKDNKPILTTLYLVKREYYEIPKGLQPDEGFGDDLDDVATTSMCECGWTYFHTSDDSWKNCQKSGMSCWLVRIVIENAETSISKIQRVNANKTWANYRRKEKIKERERALKNKEDEINENI